MAYGARILKRSLRDNGEIYLQVAFWDDTTQKSRAPDHVNDFRIELGIPIAPVVRWQRRINAGVKELRRADTGDWISAGELEALFPGVQPMTETLTPFEWTAQEIQKILSDYVEDWRAQGKPAQSFVDPVLDGEPVNVASLPAILRSMPADIA